MNERRKKGLYGMLVTGMLTGCLLLSGCVGTNSMEGNSPGEVTITEGVPAPSLTSTELDEQGDGDIENEESTEPAYTAMNLTKEVNAASDTKEIDETFVSGATRFSLQMMKKVAEGEGNNKNYMISSLSVQMALAMAANGADGDTRLELERLLCGEYYEEGDLVTCGDSSMGMEELNLYLNTYVKQLAESENVVFQNANSIWIYNDESKIKVEDSFLKRIAGFKADCFLAPFDDSTVKDINSWVNYHTNGMIPSLLGEIPQEAVIYLINAIAFEGKWDQEFQDSQLNDAFVFRSAAGQEQTVTGMCASENIYLEDAHAKGFVKYYKDGKFGFAALLPEEGMTPEEYISQLSADGFTELFQNKQYGTVHIAMPKFSSDYDTELSTVLKMLGVEQVFTETADFSKMGKTDTGLLFISRVLHKTHIEVDESGTKAAAVTSVEMNKATSAFEENPKEVILDRPFVYAIMDMDTGLPVFMGVLNSVE